MVPNTAMAASAAITRISTATKPQLRCRRMPGRGGIACGPTGFGWLVTADAAVDWSGGGPDVAMTSVGGSGAVRMISVDLASNPDGAV